MPKQERHFQSQGVHLSSKVLNLHVVKQLGLAESQKAHEVVAPLPVHIVDSVGDCWAPQNIELCNLTSLITPLKLYPILSETTPVYMSLK